MYHHLSRKTNHQILCSHSGSDGKPFKTRDGGTVKLESLIDEAFNRSKEVIASKNPDASPIFVENTAKALSIAAIKYADLSKNRLND
ncbi:MAG: arginine--tRNA ligase, partial [Magnetovibrio sp.]|nr:arginine--tRNA ligase [Magnetovibrio sp.]